MALAKDRLLSFSQLDLFDECERRYYFERVRGEKAPANHYLVVGQTYHDALAEMVKQPETELAAIVSAATTKFKDQLVEVGTDPETLVEEMLSNLVRVQETLFTKHGVRPAKAGKAPFVEQKFVCADLGFAGVIDLASERAPVVNDSGQIRSWEEKLCIMDYKIVAGKRRRSARDAEYSPQLGIYGLVLPPAECAAFVEIPRDLDQEIRVRRVDFTPLKLHNFRVWIARMRDAILSRGEDEKAYRPTGMESGLCSPMWCSHYEKCYKYEGERPGSGVKFDG